MCNIITLRSINVDFVFVFGVLLQRKTCIQTCKYWCEWVSCRCVIDRDYSQHFALNGLLSQDNGNGNEPILLTSSTEDPPNKSTVPITTTPDIQYLDRMEVNVDDPEVIEVNDIDEYEQIRGALEKHCGEN